MTPDEHAARAERLAADAERFYEICLLEYNTNINEDDHSDEPHIPVTDLAILTATTQLAQLHATLALRRPPASPSATA